mgnify:CR=1 FL=1
MALTEAQKRAMKKYRAANAEKINARIRARWAEIYEKNHDKICHQSALAYQKRKEQKNANDLGNYYFKKQWAILRAIDVF